MSRDSCRINALRYIRLRRGWDGDATRAFPARKWARTSCWWTTDGRCKESNYANLSVWLFLSVIPLWSHTVVYGCLICHRGNVCGLTAITFAAFYLSSLCFLAYPASHYRLALGRQSLQSWPWTMKALCDLWVRRQGKHTHLCFLRHKGHSIINAAFPSCSPQQRWWNVTRPSLKAPRARGSFGRYLGQSVTVAYSLAAALRDTRRMHDAHMRYRGALTVFDTYSSARLLVNVPHRVSAAVITPVFYYCCCLLSSFHDCWEWKRMILLHTVSESIIRNSECDVLYHVKCLSLCI